MKELSEITNALKKTDVVEVVEECLKKLRSNRKK